MKVAQADAREDHFGFLFGSAAVLDDFPDVHDALVDDQLADEVEGAAGELVAVLLQKSLHLVFRLRSFTIDDAHLDNLLAVLAEETRLAGLGLGRRLSGNDEHGNDGDNVALHFLWSVESWTMQGDVL